MCFTRSSSRDFGYTRAGPLQRMNLTNILGGRAPLCGCPLKKNGKNKKRRTASLHHVPCLDHLFVPLHRSIRLFPPCMPTHLCFFLLFSFSFFFFRTWPNSHKPLSSSLVNGRTKTLKSMTLPLPITLLPSTKRFSSPTPPDVTRKCVSAKPIAPL